jgi:iron complex outermembrane receptor protein
MGIERILRARTILAATGLSALAFATATPAWSQAAAKEAASDTQGLQDIVVTATYRETNLQKTPLAITALSNTQLESQHITSVSKLGDTVPNLFTRPSVGGQGPTVNIALRGVEQHEFNYAFEPGIGIYIDDVYHSTVVGSDFDLQDLQRVEVLRGPQGTLFGQSSLGGAIRLYTKTPDGTGGGTIEAQYGRFNRVDVKATADFTVVPDMIFGRVSGHASQVTGFVKQLDFTCQMNKEGTPELAGSFPTRKMGDPSCQIGTLGGRKTYGVRAALRLVPTDRFEINLKADYDNDTGDNAPEVLVTTLPPYTNATFNAVNAAYMAKYGIQYDNRFVPKQKWTNYATYADPLTGRQYPNDASVEQYGVSGAVDWDATDNIHAKFIAAYRRYTGDYQQDPDNSPLGISNALGLFFHEQTSLEARFTGKLFNGMLEWTAGGYYFRANSHLGGAIDPYFGASWSLDDSIRDKTNSAFVHGVFHLTDRLGVTGGLRYSNVSKAFTFNHPGLLVVPTPSVGRSKRVDWKAGIDFQVTNTLLFYGQAATGFRPPGVSPRPITANQLSPFPAESMTSYELGFKGDFLDHRLRLNAAAFYSDYSKRLSAILKYECLGVAQPPTPVDSPDQCAIDFRQWYLYLPTPAKVYGIELEATAEPIDNLTINASMGYNHFKVEAKRGDPGYRDPDELIQPKIAANAGIQYKINTKGGSITPRLDWIYTSHMTYGPNTALPPDPRYTIPAYSIFNGRIEYTMEDEQWTVALSVTNLFNKAYDYNNFGLSGFALSRQPGRPSEWLVSVKRHF